jgi:hypothetical protein
MRTYPISVQEPDPIQVADAGIALDLVVSLALEKAITSAWDGARVSWWHGESIGCSVTR